MPEEKLPESLNNPEPSAEIVEAINNGETTQTVEIPSAAVQAIMQVASRQFLHQGPIPDAKSFEQYEKTCAGAADRILKMAEKEQDCRLVQEPINNKQEFIGRMTGQVIGVVTLMVIVGCGTYLASGTPSAGQIAVACTMLAAPVVLSIEKVTDFFRRK